jgi:hypothetical protein
LTYDAGPAGSWLFRWRIARAAAFTTIAILLLVTIIVCVHTAPNFDCSELIGLLFVAAFSGAAGFAELSA